VPTKRPSFETLLALAMGELSDADVQAAEAAIASDARLARQFDELRRSVVALRASRMETPPAEWVSSAKAIFKPAPRVSPVEWLNRAVAAVASLVFDSRSQPALAGMRGESEGTTLSYESPLASVDLQVTGGEASGWTVLGQVDAEEATGSKRLAFVRQGTLEIAAETTTDEHGRFRVCLSAGEYDLLCELSNELLRLDAVRIGD